MKYGILILLLLFLNKKEDKKVIGIIHNDLVSLIVVAI